MSVGQGTGTFAIEHGTETRSRRGSNRVSWSLKFLALSSLCTTVWFYLGVEAYRTEITKAFFGAHEEVVSAVEAALKDDRAVGKLGNRAQARKWLRQWGKLPNISYTFISTAKGKLIASGGEGELPASLSQVVTSSDTDTPPIRWVPAETGRWLLATIPLNNGALDFHLAWSDAPLTTAMRNFQLRMVGVSAAVPIVLSMVLFLLLGPAVRRVNDLASRMARLGQGHFDVKIHHLGGGDIGRLEGAFNAALWNLKGRMEKDVDDKYRRQRDIREMEEALKALRSGDLNVKIANQSVPMRQVNALYNVTVQELGEFLHSLRDSSGLITERARGMTAASRDVTIKSNEQKIQSERLKTEVASLLGSLEEATEATEREQEALSFLASITETGEGSVMQVVTDIYHKVDEGSKQVSHKIRDLEQQIQEVSKMTELVAEVAGQTNLLSLNAALEASRAGEQGRGFAAVADEIRKLAVKVTETSEEIQGTIETAVTDSSDALALLERSGSEMAGSKVMVEAALASFSDLVESSRSARTNSEKVHGELVEVVKITKNLHSDLEQLANRSSDSVQGLDAMSDAMAVITRVSEESVKRLNRLKIDPPKAAAAGRAQVKEESLPAQESSVPASNSAV